jgi:hypothetical protein
MRLLHVASRWAPKHLRIVGDNTEIKVTPFGVPCAVYIHILDTQKENREIHPHVLRELAPVGPYEVLSLVEGTTLTLYTLLCLLEYTSTQ